MTSPTDLKNVLHTLTFVDLTSFKLAKKFVQPIACGKYVSNFLNLSTCMAYHQMQLMIKAMGIRNFFLKLSGNNA